MADKDTDAEARADYRKKLATFSLAQRELVGRAIVDGLINPDIVASSGGGGNYVQDGGPYGQSGGGNHWQGGNGGYNQSKAAMELGFDPAEMVTKLVNEQLKVAEQLKTRG